MILITSNEEINDIIKILKSFEESGSGFWFIKKTC